MAVGINSPESPIATEALKAPITKEPILPINPGEAEIIRKAAQGGLPERYVEEQLAAYNFYLQSLDKRVDSGKMTPGDRRRILANLFVAKDLQTEEMYKDAKIDPLTNLPNRSAFSEALENAVKSGEKFAVMRLDIDHFKDFNDNHGHKAGDLVLIQTALVLRNNVRAFGVAMPYGVENPRKEVDTTDFVAREGGEEFLILLEGISEPEELKQVGERLNHAFSDNPFLFTNNTGDTVESNITVSLGGSLYNGEDSKQFLNGIDTKLYQAKNNGRNQTVV